MEEVLTEEIAGVVKFIVVFLEVKLGVLVLTLKIAEGGKDGDETLPP